MDHAPPLTEQARAKVKKRQAAVRASLAVEGMFLTAEEEQLFNQMDEERLSPDEGARRIIEFNQQRRMVRAVHAAV